MHIYQVYSKIESKCLETQEKSQSWKLFQTTPQPKIYIQTVPETLGIK